MDNTVESIAVRIFNDNSDDPVALWTALEESELTRAWTSMGAELSLSDVFGLIRLSGTTVLSVPFSETLFATHLLSTAGLPIPSGPGSVAITQDNADNNFDNSTSLQVPFGREANYVVAVTGPTSISLFTSPALERTDSVGIDPMYKLSLNDLETECTATLPVGYTMDRFNLTGALVRSAQMCGAMDAILELTLAHTTTREQFGRPLARFQAIQHLLAEIAGEVAASSAIVEGAVESFEQSNRPDFRHTACAKIRTSEAAGLIAANAHQAHGAIGYTQEYALSTYTRRLWRWREEFGNETQWALALGKNYTGVNAGTLTEEFFSDHT